MGSEAPRVPVGRTVDSGRIGSYSELWWLLCQFCSVLDLDSPAPSSRPVRSSHCQVASAVSKPFLAEALSIEYIGSGEVPAQEIYDVIPSQDNKYSEGVGCTVA